MTGATGGIGSKVAKKLLKAGKYQTFQSMSYNQMKAVFSFINIGARVVMFVQDPTKIDSAMNLKNP